MDEDAANVALNIDAPTDADGDDLTITITAVPSGGTIKTSDGSEVTTNSNISITQLTGLTFTPDSDANNDNTSFGVFSYSVSDGSLSDASTITFSVTAVNDPPNSITISSTTVDEGIDGALIGYITVNDIDSVNSFTYTLSGTDAQSLEIITGSGDIPTELRLRSGISADYTTKSSYSITITATDASGLSISTEVTIEVIDSVDNIQGQVMDGYVAGATVWQDLNNNGVLDSGEPNTTTDAMGNFTLENYVSSSDAPILIQSGFDLATNQLHPSILEVGATSLNIIDGADVISGGEGDDSINGKSGSDTLDGGTGKDTMTGGSGSDTFIIRSGDGSTTLANADVITDFTDGTDLIGMDGLNFGELTIEQGTGDYANHTLISITAVSYTHLTLPTICSV